MTTQNWPPVPFGRKKRKDRTPAAAPGAAPSDAPPAARGPDYEWLNHLPRIDTSAETIVVFNPRPKGGPGVPRPG